MLAADSRWLVRNAFDAPVTHPAAFGVCLFRMTQAEAREAIAISDFIAMMKRMPFPKPDFVSFD